MSNCSKAKHNTDTNVLEPNQHTLSNATKLKTLEKNSYVFRLKQDANK